uniref:Uncharacterized protein n=1 Tax=Entomoneis paludosa TaxID=265537 RepID=A0A7S2YT93_9STRA|mmetsp:Transcript_8934/g.18528  ORF Transcript_8934/g.18528 Transcript_8934/m.18528 type:complete len:522 (+) Transcript_8934:127-1692(+)
MADSSDTLLSSKTRLWFSRRGAKSSYSDLGNDDGVEDMESLASEYVETKVDTRPLGRGDSPANGATEGQIFYSEFQPAKRFEHVDSKNSHKSMTSRYSNKRISDKIRLFSRWRDEDRKKYADTIGSSDSSRSVSPVQKKQTWQRDDEEPESKNQEESPAKEVKSQNSDATSQKLVVSEDGYSESLGWPGLKGVPSGLSSSTRTRYLKQKQTESVSKVDQVEQEEAQKNEPTELEKGLEAEGCPETPEIQTESEPAPQPDTDLDASRDEKNLEDLDLSLTKAGSIGDKANEDNEILPASEEDSESMLVENKASVPEQPNAQASSIIPIEYSDMNIVDTKYIMDLPESTIQASVSDPGHGEIVCNPPIAKNLSEGDSNHYSVVSEPLNWVSFGSPQQGEDPQLPHVTVSEIVIHDNVCDDKVECVLAKSQEPLFDKETEIDEESCAETVESSESSLGQESDNYAQVFSNKSPSMIPAVDVVVDNLLSLEYSLFNGGEETEAPTYGSPESFDLGADGCACSVEN